MKHKDILKDWSYLFEEIGAAEDMTGGYVDQEDLDKLLKNPTKKTANSCLLGQIAYWFDVGPELNSDEIYTTPKIKLKKLIKTDEKVLKIKEKYGF